MILLLKQVATYQKVKLKKGLVMEGKINFNEDGRILGRAIAKEADLRLRTSGFCMHTARPEVVFKDDNRESITLGQYIQALGLLASIDTDQYFNGYSNKRTFTIGLIEAVEETAVVEGHQDYGPPDFIY